MSLDFEQDLGRFVSFPSTWTPDWVVSSAWVGHAPFGFWLMNEARPRALVELGVHSGCSYMAFCQAAKNLGLDTRCYGVDTWKSDEHTDECSEAFTKLQSCHNKKYDTFSSLLKMTFDEASSYFEADSVDLLHIDGRHFYDDVKHDFETWRPKLSDKAVVLLHDINVRERQFGVWEFWQEIRQKYPSFEFHHSHGLGVLGVGAEIPRPIEFLCRLDEKRAAGVRNIYARLGDVLAELQHAALRIEELSLPLDRVKGECERLKSAVERELHASQTLREQALQADIERLEQERQADRANINELQDRVLALHQQGEAYQAQTLDARRQLDAVVNSTIWQSAMPLRAAASGLPRPVRRALRRTARLAYWGLTPWAIPRRLRALRDRTPAVSSATPADYSSPGTATAPVATVDHTTNDPFSFLAPLGTFRVRTDGIRVTMVTDSINAESLFGGPATAIVFSAVLARRLGAQLRIVTRSAPAHQENVRIVLSANRIAWDGNIEFDFVPAGGARDVPIGDEEIFVTTSWWTTRAVRPTVDPARLIYLLQEDERMFYPHGDERLRCAETLGDPAIRFVINTELLFDHLMGGEEPLPNIGERGIWFEPAFPAFEKATVAGRAPGNKRHFMFYARPQNLSNLYWRGLEAIAVAIEERILDPDLWEVHLAGRDLSPVKLPHGVVPKLHQNLSWPDYAKLIGQVDVGLSLLDTPHPSYPSLDLAASGAVVVTNRHGRKTTLARYSDNILCVDPTAGGLRRGIDEAVALAENMERRQANFRAARIGADWEAAFAPALAGFFPGGH